MDWNHQLDDDFEDDGEQKVYWKFQNDFWPHVGSENEGNPKAVVEAKQVIPVGLIQMRILKPTPCVSPSNPCFRPQPKQLAMDT